MSFFHFGLIFAQDIGTLLEEYDTVVPEKDREDLFDRWRKRLKNGI
jgi:hypothetical protein